ncbi:dephospho-CoA kinase [Methylocapsa sp. S129]|uniref:dephospho-CoA kinase n=1 Tax=Methylocapsa sp. S129 TaxID=1641869 RepID=UPI00131C3F91|nr:dephospho-CoA kinase [Methylocapsa sp. S129]
MIVVGLTGSIAMGKSTASAMLAAEGAPVFDSDAAVHALYGGSGAQAVEMAFPGVLVQGAIDRDRLAQRVMGDGAALARLEGIVHPMVAKAREEFLSRAAARGVRLVVADVPLLFESGSEKSVDIIIVVSASEIVQKARALAREGMTLERFAKIIARQMPDREKRRRAHVVIDTSGAMDATRAQLRGFLRCASSMIGKRANPDA